ncbi:MAG TPA: hypothetical protein VF577_01230 [Allosphingosinicella sp.]|jgi:hypothetical protein
MKPVDLARHALRLIRERELRQAAALEVSPFWPRILPEPRVRRL